ncbi:MULTISPECIES: Ldh family oxidoreductase [unclassified Achromobacter]|uniref:Ldh family oxidoreductase n=1 Tax=unclassified Achromobacter TaxID=2626865 RepID=UPI000B519F90|nr:MULTISPECIES: Ldh family oxidoreductase [unclassified Achromobacter]OWT71390.1 dehydrogenase [Achromobacter sp. HZ34]OWT73355.1 dehydrogenase [Achromobacter sp. HZ28]
MDELLIDASEATSLAVRALMNSGVREVHARTQAEFLVEAELRGRASHGLLRLPRLIERIRNGVADPVTTGRGQWRGQAFLQVDGERGLGPVVAYSALDQICDRARQTGVAMAAISNSNHLGMLALYAESVARQGQVLFALTTSEALVHPWGGRKAMLGTNPVAIGVPAQPRPFVLDMATSLISMGQVHDYANRGQPLEPGWALDSNGDPTLDAAAARQGSISPFGGPKGYALGLGFEVMVAALTASALGTDVTGTLDSETVCNKGDIFIVIEPAAKSSVGSVSAYLEALRASSSADPARPVNVPGDRAHAMRERSLASGVSIAPAIWDSIREYAGVRARS